ncbi:MAG: oligosaccharide flippase family protein, partial [Halobacteriaceae archaeon]
FLLAAIAGTALGNVASAGLMGLSRVASAGFVDFVDVLAGTVVKVVLVFYGFGLLALVTGGTVGSIIGAVIAVVLVPIGVSTPSRSHFRDLYTYARYTFVSGATGRFYDNVDILVIGAFLSSSAVGIYTLPYRFSFVITIFSRAITSVLLPSVSQLASEEQYERVSQVASDGIIYSTMLAIPATVGMVLLSRQIIVTLFTPAFAEGASVAVLLVALQIPNGLREVFQTVLGGLDRPEFGMRAGVILITANGILDLVLVPNIGIIGAAIGSFVGVTLATVYLGYQIRTVPELSDDIFPFRQISEEVVAAAVMGVIVLWMWNTVGMPQLQRLIVVVSAAIVSYSSVLVGISPGIRNRIRGILRDVVVGHD